jgi:hypothetical protein
MTKSTRMRWVGHIGRMEKMRNACKILVGRCEEKRGLGWLGRKCEDNIKMDVKTTGL